MTSTIGALGVAQAIDAVGDDLERIDVEAGVGFIEQRELRLEHQHLQDLVALLLAAGEALVDAARQEASLICMNFIFRRTSVEELEGVELRQATLACVSR